MRNGSSHVVTLLLFIVLGVMALVLGTGLPNKVKRIAEAFAHAEGFYASGDPLPKRANNPGDLKMGDKGNGEIAGKTVYATVEQGWLALYKQVTLILTGMSKVYKPSMTISQIAHIYTGEDSATSWARTVAQQLGVTPETPINEVL